jgi:hypothetical protein
VINLKIFKDMKNYRIYFVKTLIALSVGVMFFVSCKEEEEISTSTACDILTFKIGELSWEVGEAEITHVYPSAILPTPLTPTITLSPGATVNPSSGQEQNNFFKDGGVTYIVTAEDRATTKTYVARAIRTPYSGCEILSFIAGGKEWNINQNDSLITYIFSADTQETSLTPIIEMSPGARIRPVATERQNFFTEQGVKYTVTAEDGKRTKTYTVKARKIYTGSSITSFSVDGTPWTISDTNISYAFPPEITEKPLTPIITLSQGAKINPPSGVAQNFFAANGVTYTVTAEDSTITKTYIVKARRVSSECNIVSFSADGKEWTINEDDRLITYVFPSGTTESLLRPTILLPTGAKVSPLPGEEKNFFAEEGVTYTVTAEDGVTTRTYTVKATVAVPVKYDMRDWVVVTTVPVQEYEYYNGDQNIFPGGYSMLAIDNDPVSGWNSAIYYDPDPAFPQPLIIDMKETKSISKVIVTGAYFNNVKLYLTDDPQIADYETHWINWDDPDNIRTAYDEWANAVKERIPDLSGYPWGTPIAETRVENGSRTFSFDLLEAREGRFLIIVFPDNDGNYDSFTMIEVLDIEVYSN